MAILSKLISSQKGSRFEIATWLLLAAHIYVAWGSKHAKVASVVTSFAFKIYSGIEPFADLLSNTVRQH